MKTKENHSRKNALTELPLSEEKKVKSYKVKANRTFSYITRICSWGRQMPKTNILLLQVFRSSAIYFGIVCILGVTFNLGIILLYLSTKQVFLSPTKKTLYKCQIGYITYFSQTNTF